MSENRLLAGSWVAIRRFPDSFAETYWGQENRERGTCWALLVCIVHKYQSFQRKEAHSGTSMPCAAANAFEVDNLWMLFDKIGMNPNEILGVGEKAYDPQCNGTVFRIRWV